MDNEDTFRKAGEFVIHFYLIKSLVTPQKVVDTVHGVFRPPL